MKAGKHMMPKMAHYRMLIAAGLLSLLLTTSGASAKSPPPGSGSADVPANILLLLDVSGSMAELLPSGDIRYPTDVAFDSLGNVYVAKYYDMIEKYGPDGEFITSWGSYGTANGRFDYVYSLAIDSNDIIYVSDERNDRVQKFNTNGTYLGRFSVGGDAYGIEIGPADTVYVATSAGRIEKRTSSGTSLQNWSISNVRYLAYDAVTNSIYLTRPSNNRVERRDLNGNLLTTINLSWSPWGIDVDADGNLFVSRNDNGRVYKLSPTGTQLGMWGSTGGSAGQFRNPRGIEINPANGSVNVADYGNHRIQTHNGTMVITNQQKTRMDAAKNVIRTIVSDSNLTAGANFGLMTWSSNAQMRVNITSAGAGQIYNMINGVNASGSTYLAPAMNLAQSYFTGANSPMTPGASCQQNIVIVISDGYWFDNPVPATQALYNNHGIKTFVIGFTTASNSSYVDVSQAGGSYPDSPLFTDNEAGLLDALAQYIRQIISSQLSFTVPTIIPGISNSDHILQSTFLFKEHHQWKGHLFKYALLSDGTMGSMVWDAGARLNQTPAANRQLWTVADQLSHSMNNFTAANIVRLRPAMEENASVSMTDEALTGLINFVRGADTYSEYPLGTDDEGATLIAGERWKLADIYHSKAVAVGRPSAYYSDEANPKSESYYRAVNNYQAFRGSSLCGSSCSTRPEVIYVGSNSGMLHAFNSSTGDEKWGFIPPGVLPGFRSMISAQASRSISINGVDGSPAVKDIYYNGSWKTVLFGGLRQGGHSYYALDITNPDAPAFLFSFAHNKFNNRVSYWNSSGTRSDYTPATVPDEYNYFALGESWSDPLIMNMQIGPVRKWVGVFGGGYNNNVSGSYGNVIFVIDLEDGGKIIQRINIPDNNGGNGIVNAVPPRLTAITADGTTTFPHAGAMVYFTDTEGSLWKVNLTDSGTLYETTRVFNNGATSDNDRMCFHELTPTILSDGRLMHFFGTADMTRIGRVSNSIANRGYGAIDPNYPNFTPVGSPYTVTSMQNVTSAQAICPTSNQNGWYIDLDTNERVTAAATVRSRNVVFSRYTPDTNNICDSGSSKISEHDFACGNRLRETNLGAGMATEAIVYKDKMYIGISSDAPDQGTLPAGFVKQGNLIIGAPVLDSETKVKIQYWKEDF